MRREVLLSIPILGLAVIVQTAIFSRIVLLSGCADIVLLILAAWGLQERARGAWVWGAVAGLLVGLVSGVPWLIYLLVYLGVVGAARLLTRRVWQAPLLAMFTVTLAGTLTLSFAIFAYRSFFVVPLTLKDAFVQVILPSSLLNLLLAIPVHTFFSEIASHIYPMEVA